MKFIILIISLFVSNAHSTDANTFCDSVNAKNVITKPFSVSGKTTWCITAHCILKDGESERKKCVKVIADNDKDKNAYPNGVMVSIEDMVKGENSLAFKSKGTRKVLYGGDQCFEECRPTKVSGLFKDSIKHGLEKASCASCAINLPLEEPPSFEIVGYGTTVYQGQKCFYSCKLPLGDYQEERPYSNECLTCIGSQGFRPVTEHLVNKAGRCFELRNESYGKIASEIPAMICKDDDNVYTTRYKKSSAYSMSALIFNEPLKCFEVDRKSGGEYYKKTVDMINCDPSAAVNSDDRGNTKDNPTRTPAKQSGSGSGARKN